MSGIGLDGRLVLTQDGLGWDWDLQMLCILVVGSVTQVGIVHLTPGPQPLGTPCLCKGLGIRPRLTADADQG